jgi:hypothetical protein
MRARRLTKALVPVGVGLLAFVVYLQTLLPGVGWGDIARFQYVAKVWGIPHRFGYPLYIVLSRLFGYLPVGDLAYRINLMSALFAALTVVMVYLIVMRLVDDWVAAASAALSFAFSVELWRQSVVAEVYSLNAFLIGAVVLVLLAWHQTQRIGLLYLGVGLYALSFGNHLTVVTLLPAVIYLILVTDYRVLLNLKHMAILAGLVLLGAMQYLYVIIRAHQQPLLNELGPFSWRGWIHWMARSRFQGQFFGYGLGAQLDRMRIYLELLGQQFFRWGYILGWIGAWERLRADLKSFIFLALVGLGIYVFGMNYGGATFPIYVIPSYLIFALFLGCGLSALRQLLDRLLGDAPQWLGQPPVAMAVRVVLAAIILLMPLYPLWRNWAEVDQSENTYYRDVAQAFVEQAGPEFVLVESEPFYDDLEAILYVAWGENGWNEARWVPPGEIDSWLEQGPVYAWSDGADYHGRYIEQPIPGLPLMVRITEERDG